MYTPQIVVDGLLHVVGSDENAVEQAMQAAAKRLANVRVPVSMHGDGDTLVINVGAAPEASYTREATIWLAIAKEQEIVSISRGENRGRTLSYHHPVRELSPVGMWKGDAMTLRLPLKDLKTMGGRLPHRAGAGRELWTGARRRRVRGRCQGQLIKRSPLAASLSATAICPKTNGSANRPVYTYSGMKWPGPREDPGGAGGLRSEASLLDRAERQR